MRASITLSIHEKCRFHLLSAALFLCSFLFPVPNSPALDLFNSGLFYDQFELTLAPGTRTEIAGPLYYSEQSDSRHTWGLPPFFSHTADPDTDSEESDFLYPVLTYDRYGEQYRWQLFQLLSFAGGPTQVESERDRFTLFPIYFQQRSSDSNENYTALFPIYGTLKHRFNRDEIHFVLFPAYSETRRKDVVTDNYLYPIFHVREGDGLKGWQVWPLVGHETKEVTQLTNRFGDVEFVGGHDKWFVLWPIYHYQWSGKGTTNSQLQKAVIPLYNIVRSPNRDSTTVLWPFFTWIDDREKKYVEKQLPWPFVAVARGEGKNTTRVWPLFGHAQSQTLSSRFYLWPLYRENRLTSAPLDRHRTRILFFLYSDVIEKNTDTKKSRRRTDLFPFFTHRRDLNGNTRLQVLSILEPFVPNNKSIERSWSHVWSLYRAERNAATGKASQSLLWNLWRRETSPDTRKSSLLFGLWQTEKDSTGKRWRILYVPFGSRKAPENHAPEG